MFMYHPDTENLGNGRFYARGWKGKQCETIAEIATLVQRYAASPCMWGGGYRLKKNFRYAEWLALDFDDGLSLEEAKDIFAPYLHLIGVTKSHGKEKSGVVADRFRVILRLSLRTHNLYDYEMTVSRLVKKYGADSACVDGARFFWPVKEIVSLEYFGKVVTVVDSSAVVEARKKREAQRKKNWLHSYKKGGDIPPRVKRKLENGVREGYRNTACYQIGADLGPLGYSENEIVGLIMNSPIPIRLDAKVEAEVRNAVRSGMKKH